MNTKTNKNGFTLAELLTAIAIIAILIGILLPALNMARNFAKEAKQKVQISSLEVGINMYKNDFGAYPPSHGVDSSGAIDYGYCGAQTLAEAMFGQDLLGVHPDTIFRYDGQNKNNFDLYPATPDQTNLSRRKALYIARENMRLFMPKDIFDTPNPNLKNDRFIICDSFDIITKNIILPGSTGNVTKSYKIGTPILYFRANTSAENPELLPGSPDKNIYDYWDNEPIISSGQLKDNNKPHKLDNGGDPTPFYDIIRDPMTYNASGLKRPVRPDSFLLISAGLDGIYGTQDDICNFEPNFE